MWFSEILLSKSKPVATGIFYRPQSQAYLTELIVKDFSLRYLLRDSNINLFQNVNYILNGKETSVCQGPVQTSINKYQELCNIFFLW